METLQQDNPSFYKLLDTLVNGKLENGHLRATAEELRQMRSRLHSVKQAYLEHLLLPTELETVISSQTKQPPSECLAAARVQHCLELGTENTMLGVTVEHLRAVDTSKGLQKSKTAVGQSLEAHLKAKCSRVVGWSAPHRDTGVKDSLIAAKMGQLPQVLRQQVRERKVTKEEIDEARRDIVNTMTTKHKVLVEMCTEMRAALEGQKLGVMREVNSVSLNHTNTQCKAMIGKLEVMYHQLLKGICSEGRLEALKEIKYHLEVARAKLEEHLVQSEQMVSHYQALGETFTGLAEQYHEILADIENKEWALAELTKTTG